MKVLCVAEKPSISKAVARILSLDNFQTKQTSNKYIKNYEFNSTFNGRPCQVVMTCVSGHITNVEFAKEYKAWKGSDPSLLFDAPIHKTPSEDNLGIVQNLENEGRNAHVLFIWTDGDREGENIGSEIYNIVQRVNPRLDVKRAKFSVVQPREIKYAWSNPVLLDFKQAAAVDARIELDLRIGAAFTRLQTLCLQARFGVLAQKILSYGPCILYLSINQHHIFKGQFPTLGFVVDRYKQVTSFVSEPYWAISLSLKTDGQFVSFTWQKGTLFDEQVTKTIHMMLLAINRVKVLKVTSKPTSKWRPLPLTTVEMQKLGSNILKISSDRMMQIAEKLYNEGYISYPRTETNIFDKNFELKPLIGHQQQDNRWGNYATALLDGKFVFPNGGGKSDEAHPPIHPTREGSGLQGDESRVYELITRRFLGCCSENAKGHSTSVVVSIGEEIFNASGLVILERNYLEVYTYDKWNGNQLPNLTTGDTFIPDEIKMYSGKTTGPSLLTEAELIGLMDKSGIGTDATIHEHIKKILEREYADKENNIYFCPTVLGVALIESYDEMDVNLSLSKPILRSQMENQMKRIGEGSLTKEAVIESTVTSYKEAFRIANDKSHIFIDKFQQYIGQAPDREEEIIDRGIEVMPCSKCNSKMYLKTLRDETKKMIGCSGYPACRECIFLPDWVIEINVLNTLCENDCGSKNIAFKLPRDKIPPYLPTSYTTCIKCDHTLRNLFLERTFTNPVPANANIPNRPRENAPRQKDQDRNMQGNRERGTTRGRVRAARGVTKGRANTDRGTHRRNNQRDDAPYQRNNQARPEAPQRNSARANQNNNQEEILNCECGKPSQLKTVRKDGPNNGKTFYGCGQDTRCAFFKWS